MRSHSTVEFKPKKSVPAVALALSLCLLANVALAQQPLGNPPSQSRAPFTKENILSFLRGLAPERRDAGLLMLAAAIRDSGVDFEVTPAVEQELRDAGASAELAAAARANFRPAFAAPSQAPTPAPTSAAQSPSGARGATPAATPAERDAAMQDNPPVVTKHEVRVGGRTLRYTVTTGVMPLRNAAGETEARIFYMAYTADGVGDRAQRPLMFSFNGGPGSASVWLHLGALAPRRVRMLDDGQMPPPPFQLVDNEYTWLDFTDI